MDFLDKIRFFLHEKLILLKFIMRLFQKKHIPKNGKKRHENQKKTLQKTEFFITKNVLFHYGKMYF